MKKGYYRTKISDLPEGETIVNFYNRNTLYSTAIVRMRSFCDNQKLIKYLDKDGKYRFFPFNKFNEIKDTPTSLGTVNKFITDILDSQSNSRNLGFKTTRKMSLVADNLDETELNVLQDIYSSPCIYLYIGDGQSDLLKDWILVSISGDGISKLRKQNFKKVQIEITLPEIYSQTLK